MELSLRKNVLCFFILIASLNAFAQPTISSFTPSSGPVGATITITGSNFSSTPTNNIVYFGVVRANVTAATTTSLTVTVPAGATYQPISVTVGNLIAYSNNPFIVTFSGASPQFTSQSFEYVTHIDSVSSDIETTKYVLGDMDGDNKIDVITVDRLNNTMSVYRNTTTGLISFATKVDFTTGQSPRAVSVGDIDGDGKLDVVVSNFTDNTVSVFKNTTVSGVISFASRIDFMTSTQPSAISIADLDKDGKPDLVINTINLEGYVSILRNTSSGTPISFAPKIDLQTQGGSIEEIRTVDIDGDGKQDIILPNYNSNVLNVFRNTSSVGIISFAAKIDIGTFTNPDDLEIGDLNDDGKLDIVVGHYTDNRILVLQNVSSVGTITFQSNGSYTGGITPSGMAINDLDGDSKPDLVVNDGLESFSLYKNTSSSGNTISFNPGVKIPAVYNSKVMSADFDGDGKTDLAFETGILRVTLWKNRTTSPQIISFTPSSGNVGTTVTIQGVNFSSINSVSFGGVPASSFTVVNATTITAVVDTGATGDVVVKNLNDSTRKQGFIFTAPPVLTSFSPISAATGTTITITGNYLSGTSAVNFGGVPATSFLVVNSHSITAIAGNGSSGDISVTTQYGTATISGFTYIPIPTVISFSPTSGGTGSIISINGTNLLGTTAVSFGGVPVASFTVVSSVLINAVIGSGASGAVSITTPYGTATKNGFVYILPPVITSFTSASGQTGTTITITGNNLNSVTGVLFGGSAASSFTIVNSTTITAVVGTGSSGIITVTSPYGSSSQPGFTYLSRPIITNFNPTSGPIGTIVSIKGNHFNTASQVYFGGAVAASFSIISDDSIVAVTATGNSGPITIVNPIGSGFSTGDYTFIYPQPTMNSFTPTSGATGTQINISGSNFLPGLTNVSFGNVPARDIIVNSSSSITATVGSGASGDVSVSTPGGNASLLGFKFLRPPVITQVNPLNAVEGTAVVIAGKSFTGTTAVSFGGVPVVSFVVINDLNITAIVGTGASGDVAVTNADGTGTLSGFIFAPLTIASFTPTSGSLGTVINIKGTGFVNINSVYFGGIRASSIIVNSDTSITATVASGNSGLVSITTWGGIVEYKEGFTFISPNTSIYSMTPSVGGVGTVVTINGSGFSGATAVSFGGTPAASFVVNSPYSITATLAGGSPGDISVTSPSGTGSFSGFVYAGAPVISGFTPEAAMAGTYITITGSNFNAIASGNIVYFGGIKANVISASANSLIVLVPVNATYDCISVTNNHLTGYSQKKFKRVFVATEPISSNCFEARVDSTVGSRAGHVNVTDFDTDGKTDVVVCDASGSINEHYIALFKNSSTPGLISFLAKNTVINNSRYPDNSVTGDLDGDGKLDLIVGNGGDGQTVSVYRNMSTVNNISFGNEIYLGGSGLDGAIAACADIDLDGRLDVIYETPYTGVGIFKNTTIDGVISFAGPVYFSAGANPYGVLVSDLDMDGKPDLIFIGSDIFSTAQIRILRNSSTPGHISFDPLIAYKTISGVSGVAIGDIDGDGKNDILVTDYSTNSISVFRNLSIPGAITMESKKSFLSFSQPSSVAIGDVNGDGKPDVISALANESKISLYPNTSDIGSISFGNKIDIQVGNNPASVAIADIDSDQKPDIITTNNGSGTVSFIRNKINSVLLNSFTPASGVSGTIVTITGVNLSNATGVSFGGITASSFTIVNSTTITAVVGAGASGSVSVSTPAGTVSLSGFTFVSLPTITSFTPTTAGTGMTVTITGTNFTGATTVSLGGVTASSFTVVNSTTISAIVGTGASGSVSVTTPGGTASLAGFVYNSVTGIVSPGNVNSTELTVYPNPSNTSIVIKYPASIKKTTLRFIDLLGREVKTLYLSRNSDRTDIKVDDWVPGIYTIVWSDGARFLSRVLIVQ